MVAYKNEWLYICDMQQGGVNNIKLYENKGLSLTYDVSGNVVSIANSGEIIDIEVKNEPVLTQDLEEAENNEILADYSFEFIQFDFDSDENLSKLATSIYGFVPVYEMNDLNKYLINSPFFAQVDGLNSNESHSWSVELKPRVRIADVDVKNVM